jgi:hypothetical protein
MWVREGCSHVLESEGYDRVIALNLVQAFKRAIGYSISVLRWYSPRNTSVETQEKQEDTS